MRISDWSSDVCSSDLVHNGASRAPFQYRLLAGVRRQHLLDPQCPGHVLSADPAVYFLIIPVDMLLLGTKHDTGKLALFIGALNTAKQAGVFVQHTDLVDAHLFPEDRKRTRLNSSH